MRKITAIVMFGLLWPTIACAKCVWWKDLLGICSAGEHIRKGVVEGATELGDSVFATFNYWGKLVEDYHTGTPEEKQRARELIEKVFGLKELPAQAFQVRLELSGIDTSTRPLRVALLTDTPNTIMALEDVIHDGTRSDFNFIEVRGAVVPSDPIDLGRYMDNYEGLRSRVHKEALTLAREFAFANLGIDRKRRECNVASDGGNIRNLAGTEREQCIDSVVASYQDDLARLIMSAVDDKVELRAQRTVLTFPWSLAPFLTIVIPEDDLASQPNLRIDLSIHATDDPNQLIPQFRHNVREISVKAMRKSPTMLSSDPQHGGRYKIAPIRIH